VLGSFSFTPVLNLANRGWDLDFICNVLSDGSLECQGRSDFSSAANAANSMDMENNTSMSVNLAVDQTLTLSAQWGALAVGGTITLRQLTVQVS
jgi:hypothetical protein